MKRLILCAAIAASTSVSATAAAQALELEGSIGGSPVGMSPSVRIGFFLTERLTIGLGFSASAGRTSIEPAPGVGGLAAPGQGEVFSLAIPVDLKLWILPARAGNVSPTVRVFASYARSFATGFPRARALSGGLLIGATYMIDETIGISLEGGGQFARSWFEGPGFRIEDDRVDILYRASFLLRI